ncbi:MAG: hypothetical protein HYV95_17725 [Opitutae bacterium]|nr:hypothetical protein [Opitutae bacterium]
MRRRPSSPALPAARRWPAARTRGTVLVVALLIMAVIALGITSYLNLSLGSARLAKRGFSQTAAFNLAETGAEEAVWSFNRANAGAGDAWSGWATSGGVAKRAFTGFDLGGNTAGSVKVYVDNFAPAGNVRPTVVALSTVQAPGDPPVTKMIEVSLRRRSHFTAGLMAKDRVTFSGTRTSVDSWNSDPDNNPATEPVEYNEETRNDRGSVASVSVANTAMLVNQADIWGYVSTGGAAPQVGTQGSITGRSTPDGVQIDAARVATDFTATFPNVAAPEDGTLITKFEETLGTEHKATKWRSPSLSLNGKKTLTILGDVTLVITAGPGTHAIDVTGQASIIIAKDSSLTLYAEGDVLIAGNGLANDNLRPATFQLYGTNTHESGQSIHIAGNGKLSAVAYAPNADIQINGNGDVMGSVIGRSITLTGNAAFHYDESLVNLDTGMPYGISSWRELTGSGDRSAYADRFRGW